jgi:hypothetical protein
LEKKTRRISIKLNFQSFEKKKKQGKGKEEREGREQRSLFSFSLSLCDQRASLQRLGGVFAAQTLVINSNSIVLLSCARF